jgi:DNA-binding CsgD family transcriptional regulator
VTKNEIRLFIFIKIGLENGKIAEIFGISPESVYRNRTRLRQKLGLEGSVNLEHFVRSF